MLDVKQLQSLVALDEHRHFGRAALSLGISQPALSKQLQSLESELGVRLVDRSKREVSLTAAGKLVVTRAGTCLQCLSEIRRDVDLLLGREVGQVTIGVGPAMSESFVTEAIARLAGQHPRARWVIRVDHWTQLAEWLAEGVLDLYVADITQLLEGEQFHVIPMPQQPMVVFCRRDHPLTRAQQTTPADLLRYPIAAPRMPEWGRRWFAESISERERMDRDPEFASIECENYGMLKRMVLASDCVSAALRSTIEPELRSGELVVLPIEAPLLQTQAGIVHLRHRSLSPLAEAFIQETLAAG